MTNFVTSLVLNGKEMEARGTLLFLKKAEKIYNEPNAEGIKSGGYSNIYTGLVNYDIGALDAFYKCAFPGYKEDTIDNAVMERINEFGMEALYAGALSVMEHDLLLSKQTELFWKRMEVGLNKMKNEQEKQEAREGMEQLKEMIQEILNPQQIQE